MAKKNQKPQFVYGEPSESAKKAIAFLKRKVAARVDSGFKTWAEREIILEEFQRVFKISEYYGVDPRRLGMAEANLIRLIARDFIDGFSPVSKRPGNPKSTINEHPELVTALFREVDGKGKKISQAIENVLKRGPGKGMSKDAIEGVYYRATEEVKEESRAFIEVCSEIRAQEKQRKALEEKYGKLGLLNERASSDDEADTSPIDD